MKRMGKRNRSYTVIKFKKRKKKNSAIKRNNLNNFIYI